ncbi:MAG: Nif3-like dinuclear metal center hexameric protein [Cyclobacteriaceae bacterium]|jgi:dinuclear metal center YbgI/SA1388 family protein
MVRISDITEYLEQTAPLSLQEEYDNAGLLTGNKNQELNGVLISLDATEEVIDEALRLGCNMVVSHHPIIFRGLKKITGSNYVERVIIKAIKNDIALYAIHTNLDNIKNGVNKKIADKLGLSNIRILNPKASGLFKLVTFVPKDNVLDVLNAMHDAGAGVIGDYDHCSFRTQGTGRFKPNENASPHIGERNEIEEVEEERIELIYPQYLGPKVLESLRASHPYEEVAYYIHNLENKSEDVGSGMIGHLETPMNMEAFLLLLKKKFNLEQVKYTPIQARIIKKVAVCGGSGSFLIKAAKNAGADAFISADIKYHEYFDAEGKILIADIGHYESEVFTKELIFELLKKKFSNIALQLSEVNTNPIKYI